MIVMSTFKDVETGGQASSLDLVYIKFQTTFKCTKESCQKVWTATHGWRRESNGVYCEFCNQKGKILNVVDESIKLDTYRCPKEGCGNHWLAIHDEKNDEGGQQQLCDLCETKVTVAGPPKESFGRHYFFKCGREECPVKPEWEDFSVGRPKGQRCRECRSRGILLMTSKVLLNRRVGVGMPTVEVDGGEPGGPVKKGFSCINEAI